MDVTVPPDPVIIHCNLWFSADLYHAEHLTNYHEFVDYEITNVGDTVHLKKLVVIMNDDDSKQLEVELEFLDVARECLISKMKSLESHEFQAFDLNYKVADLLS